MADALSPATEESINPLPPRDSARFRRWCYGGVFGMTLLLFGLWLFGAMRDAREAARATQCRGHFKGIAVALHNYADTYGCFPPPFVADEQGRPMHSWRVLILPWIDQQALYQKYRFDEPWDGPNNRKLHSVTIPLFNCPTRFPPGEASPITSYLAVVGPETLWPETGSVRPKDVEDGLGNTLLVVEVADSDVHWMEPRDLHVGQMAPTINPPGGQGISSPHYKRDGAHAVMADGSLRTLRNSISPATLRALLTIRGGEQIDDF